MGEVYLAQHPRLPRRDALKILRADVSADNEYRQRFIREADLAAELWHPNIVRVNDRGGFDGQLWIAMDFVAGTDAASLLRDRYPVGMPAGEVVAIVAAIASALDYAHQHDLLHRDVKPANILLSNPEDGDQRILLSDFGIARNIGDISGLTATNMTIGTLPYAAPEQLIDDPIDGRADQYALAATAYHLLTGSTLFPQSNPAAVISHHQKTRPPALADTRPDLAAFDPVLAIALAKDPADRFARCIDFAHAFTEAAHSGSHATAADPTRPAPVPSRPPDDTTMPPAQADADKQRRRRRRRILLAAATTVIACTAVAGVVGYVNRPHNHTTAVPPPETTPTSASSSAVPPPDGRPVDPASTGPAEGSSCNHAQHNNVTISNSGTMVRCVSGPDGYWWQPDTGQQAEPAIVGQQGWAACLKSFPQAQCVMSAVAVAGGINPAGPVYPPGSYAVPATVPYGTYGASIDFGTGQFSNGTAANPCTYTSYDAAGNMLNTGTFNSYSQGDPRVQITQGTTLFRTSGCTPWALTKGEILPPSAPPAAPPSAPPAAPPSGPCYFSPATPECPPKGLTPEQRENY